MTAVLDIVSWVALLSGVAFCVIGAAGLLRMPDFWSRTHAAGITETLGAGLILLGLMFQAGPGLVTIKLLMILGFLYVSSPTAGHALVRAAHASGVPFGEGTSGIEKSEEGSDGGSY